MDSGAAAALKSAKLSLHAAPGSTRSTLRRMNITQSTLLGLASAALLSGCRRDQTAQQQMEAAKTEAKTAAGDLKDYTFAQKAEFTAAMKTKLAALNQEIDQLEAKIAKSREELRAEAKPRLAALREQAAKLGTQLEEAKNATEPAWEKVKGGAGKAYDSVKDAFLQSRQWIGEKIAP